MARAFFICPRVAHGKPIETGDIMKTAVSFTAVLRVLAQHTLGMLGLSCYLLADTFFVSNRLGADGLAALNLAIPLYSLLNGVGLMLGIGGATRYAVLQAGGAAEEADRAFTGSLMLGGGAGALFVLAGILLAEPMGLWMGADGDTLEMTAVYLRTIFCFAPCFLLNNILLAFVRNDGGRRLAMAGMLAGSFSNILLDYLFLYPLGGGMFGAALATGLAPVISLAVLSAWIMKKRNGFHLRRDIPVGRLPALCGPGTAAFVTEVSSGVVLVLMNTILLRLEGNRGVAAYGIVANLALVALALLNGLSQGMQPLVSAEAGRGRKKEAQRIRRFALLLSLATAGLLYAAALLWAPALAALFNRDGDPLLGEMASQGLRLYFAGFVGAGVTMTVASYCSAAGRPRTGFALSMLRGFATVVPAVLLFSSWLGLKGVWLSVPVAETLSALAACWILLREARGKAVDIPPAGR